jgi:hypothetical protein
MGDHERMIAQQAYRMGMPMPDRIQNAPKLLPGLQLFFQAFLDLDTERTEGPIPFTSIAAYSQFFDFEEDQAEDLFYIVRKLDGLILKRRAEKRKAEANKGKRSH